MEAAQNPVVRAMTSRYEGFPGLMQGGYLASIAADDLSGPVRVQIRQSVRPGDVLTLETSNNERTVMSQGKLVMRASVDAIRVSAPDLVDTHLVETALATPLPWPKPFPDCAGCGDRSDGLGARIRPLGTRIVGEWTPGPELAVADGTTGPIVSTESVWTVTDCFTSWALFADPPEKIGDTYVTGNIALELLKPLLVGERYHLDSWVDHKVPPGVFKLGSVIVGGTIRDTKGDLIALADQELVRTDGFGMDPHGMTASADG